LQGIFLYLIFPNSSDFIIAWKQAKEKLKFLAKLSEEGLFIDELRKEYGKEFDVDRIYKYVRIMDDINNQKNNQRFIVEIICLALNANEIEMENAYEVIQQIFQKAISKGILAIKKYKLENGKAILLKKDGWVLETVPKNANEVNTNKEQ